MSKVIPKPSMRSSSVIEESLMTPGGRHKKRLQAGFQIGLVEAELLGLVEGVGTKAH